MSDVDSLRRMTRALRESRTGKYPDAGETKAAILAEAATKSRRRRFGIVWLVPLAAVLVFSTAAAAVGAARRTAWHRYLQRIMGGEAPVAALAPAPAQRAAPGEAAPIEEPAPASAPEAPATVANVAPVANVMPVTNAAPVANVAKRPTKHVVREATRAEAPPEVPTPPPAVVDDVDGRLYARAHEAHFVQRDAAAALREWDAYLAAQPDGRFALEAKYNRALCLVRLDRLEEAKASLRPFRDGRYGSYRQIEAARLLDALERR
jgi:hypothetical protein